MKHIVSFVFILTCVGCSTGTYYQSNLSFNQEFETGDLEGALTTLQAKSSEASGKKEFLYDVNNGLVLSMLGRYDDSNNYFEKAYLFGEDYRLNYLNEATSYLTNPNFTTYRGEDHEHLMLLYYKALNYVKQNNFEDALVECRRLNIRLQQLSDRYGSDNKYREDAFIHLMMGVIFEAGKDYNNAFIAYRNAYNVYTSSFQDLFRLGPPPQLKIDILRSAWLSGLIDEFNHYKEEFAMPDYKYEVNNNPELVFFWHNGLSPVKVEWGINFVIDRRDNLLYFRNENMQMVFPFNIGGYNDRDKNSLASLQIFRVAFPRYVERPVFYSKAELAVNGNNRIQLQKAEDINAIAFKCLQERMNHELSKALIRLALKKVTEMEVKKTDRTLGSVVGMINALTEHADTRNWQTLPHEISYCRVPLTTGKNKVTLHVVTQGSPDTSYDFEYEVKEGQTLFHTFTSLESHYPTY
ncbi:MAG: hypothetical protein WDO15_26330 [Bacteroidota bacterium]